MSILDAREALKQGRFDDAIAAYREELAREPRLVDTWQELGGALKQAGRLREAEIIYCNILRRLPSYLPSRLALSAMLIERQCFVEAETVAREGLAYPADPHLRGGLHNNLGLALRGLGRFAEALEHLDKAQVLNPALPGLDLLRAQTLQVMQRFDDALRVYERLIARQPDAPMIHRSYNELLYRLDRDEQALESYDRAPKTRELLLDKAHFLSHELRGDEALKVYRDLYSRDANDAIASAGIANTLMMMKRYDEAAIAFEAALSVSPSDPELYVSVAALALCRDDPEKAVVLCEQALQLAPYSQPALATLSVGLRALNDQRDEVLNGYDTLIQVFDLEPPDGFSNMEDFNAELCNYLEGIHPGTRKFHNQTLRVGTQTNGDLFGAGHALVERVQICISEALNRYINGLREDVGHPFLSRRTRGIRYNGSWSSRLRNSGFHVNHTHPRGWISSCYYVGVPDVAKDESQRQGWIKFGESSFENFLERNPARRMVRPVPGRLVLFPSYIWHGTNPFHAPTTRTTIAFDVVPGE
jgi:tetratricopeptide (TPR) repeat protein